MFAQFRNKENRKAARDMYPDDTLLAVYWHVNVCGSWGVIEESSPLRRGVRLTANTGFREPAWRSYRTIGRVGPSERDFASKSEIVVCWIWAN